MKKLELAAAIFVAMGFLAIIIKLVTLV